MTRSKGPARDVPPRPVQAEDGIVVLPRDGRPPLRVRARQLHSHRIRSACGCEMHVTLWLRSNGALAASLRRPLGARLVDDSLQSTRLDELAEQLEKACESLQPAKKPDANVPEIERILTLQGTRILSRDFMRLVGDVLADWETLRVA